MQFAHLSTVEHRIVLGSPLPFNVRDSDETLLLARGQRVDSHDQLQSLFNRGCLVDLAELQTAREEILKAPRSALPRLWARCLTQVSQTLMHSARPGFTQALDEVAAPVQTLIERDADLAIFQVLRRGGDANIEYGAQRSVHTAITALLVAQRLAWEPSQCERMFKVALTMNISMLALQGQLARQTTPLTPQQRHELQTHPMRSVQMLQLAGVSDEAWLEAVLHHHEHEDGTGYPSGATQVSELASLARRADTYTSKLASRSDREALLADVAGRQMFMQDPGHPMTAALVKEFGIYPPGCYVRLASGALAIVVLRGAVITSPVVLCLTDERGSPLPRPARLDTSNKAHAVEAVVGEGSIPVQLSFDRLATLITA